MTWFFDNGRRARAFSSLVRRVDSMEDRVSKLETAVANLKTNLATQTDAIGKEIRQLQDAIAGSPSLTDAEKASLDASIVSINAAAQTIADSATALGADDPLAAPAAVPPTTA